MSPDVPSPEGQALPHDIASVLAAMLLHCEQLEAGFRSAAELAQAGDVRALLRRRAEDYKAQCVPLRAQLLRRGHTPCPTPLVGASAWAGLSRATLPGHADALLLEACEQAEDQALEQYIQAATLPLEPAAQALLQAQRLEMKRQHELLRALRDHLRGLV